MTLSRWSDLANFVFVASGLVTASVGIGAWYLGKRLADQRETALAVVQARAATAEKELIELRERTRQRSLTPEEREHLISALKPFDKGWFEMWCQVGDPESTAFAEQLIDVFGEVGWGRQMGILPNSDAPRGVTLRVHSKDNIPAFAARFVQAAGEIGLPVAVSADPQDKRLGETRVYLIVGRKPMP